MLYVSYFTKIVNRPKSEIIQLRLYLLTLKKKEKQYNKILRKRDHLNNISLSANHFLDHCSRDNLTVSGFDSNDPVGSESYNLHQKAQLTSHASLTWFNQQYPDLKQSTG